MRTGKKLRCVRLYPTTNPPPLPAILIISDRVGCRGLRPGTLPHHRTCGLLASGGWTLESSSFSATQTVDFRTLRRVERLLRAARRSPVRDGDRSCRVPLLRSLFCHRFQSFDWLPQFLRPFARNAFSFVRSSNATRASADFPAPLSARISPGQGLFFPFAPLGATACPQ